MKAYDVGIVGAGPAGLSAALILGRCRRRVLICDHGSPRNAASHGLHGFLTRDGIEPADFLRIGRQQLEPYESVDFRHIEVVDAKRSSTGFTLILADGTTVSCKQLLLATGVVDEVPQIDGIEALYGRSVFHCPYCDGWEMRERKLAVYGRGDGGFGLALELTLWTSDLVLCTDGPAEISTEDKQRLQRHKITLREERVARLSGSNGILREIEFVNGERVTRDGLFFSTGQYQRSHLARRLGCQFNDDGSVKTGDYETTDVPGLYVAGDASRLVQLAIVAAAEGAQAAFAINKELLKADLA
jgi:thioredoxin reductase